MTDLVPMRVVTIDPATQATVRWSVINAASREGRVKIRKCIQYAARKGYHLVCSPTTRQVGEHWPRTPKAEVGESE